MTRNFSVRKQLDSWKFENLYNKIDYLGFGRHLGFGNNFGFEDHLGFGRHFGFSGHFGLDGHLGFGSLFVKFQSVVWSRVIKSLTVSV